jgi:hypothetical protein
VESRRCDEGKFQFKSSYSLFCGCQYEQNFSSFNHTRIYIYMVPKLMRGNRKCWFIHESFTWKFTFKTPYGNNVYSFMLTCFQAKWFKICSDYGTIHFCSTWANILYVCDHKLILGEWTILHENKRSPKIFHHRFVERFNHKQRRWSSEI